MRGSRNTHDRLLHILEAIERARLIVGEASPEEYNQDWLKQMATERAIEIISEASRHIPDELKATERDIPWRDIADIGNIVRHVYDSVDPDIVWSVVRYRLDALEEAIRRMQERLPSS